MYCVRRDLDAHDAATGQHCDYDVMRWEISEMERGGGSGDGGSSRDGGGDSGGNDGGGCDGGGGDGGGAVTKANTVAKYKKLLLDAFKPHFKARGFKKKAATWHRETDELIQVFNVQTSQWSEYYYFNTGIYLRALGRKRTPPDYKCHIRARLPLEIDCSLVKRARKLADFDGLKEEEARKRVIKLSELIVPLAFEWMDRFRDVASVKRELRKNGDVEVWNHRVWRVAGLKVPEFSHSK